MKLTYSKRVSPLDIAEALGGKVPANRITVEEDGDEIRVILPDGIALSDAELASVDEKVAKRKAK